MACARLVAGLYTHGHFDHVGGSVPGSGPVQGARELGEIALYLGQKDIDFAALQSGVKAWRPLQEGALARI